MDNPIVSVKVIDKDVLIARLVAEIATLRASKVKKVPKAHPVGLFGTDAVSVKALADRALSLLTVNLYLLTACERLLEMIKKKKCADYWDEPCLIRAKDAINLAYAHSEKARRVPAGPAGKGRRGSLGASSRRGMRT